MNTMLVSDVKLEPELQNLCKKRPYELLEQHNDFKSHARHSAADYGKKIISMKATQPQYEC